MQTFKTDKAAKEFALLTVGGLTGTSKMPCRSYSIPAVKCKVGALLRKVENSVCSKCYALKGNYPFPNVQKAMARRFRAINKPNWVADMTATIGHFESDYFRWHDSGDLQSVQHLIDIAQIARNLQHIKFWLPTREYQIVRGYLATGGKIPRNLIIRLSAHMIGQKPGARIRGCTYSTVDTSGGFDCLAPSQNGECRDCRACWSKKVKTVNYHKH